MARIFMLILLKIYFYGDTFMETFWRWSLWEYLCVSWTVSLIFWKYIENNFIKKMFVKFYYDSWCKYRIALISRHHCRRVWVAIVKQTFSCISFFGIRSVGWSINHFTLSGVTNIKQFFFGITVHHFLVFIVNSTWNSDESHMEENDVEDQLQILISFGIDNIEEQNEIPKFQGNNLSRTV